MIKIDFYADLVCPWCLIGMKKLDTILQRHFGECQLDIEHHPVLLIPDCPDEGIALEELITARFGRFDRSIFDRPEAEARALNMPLSLVDQPRLFPTLAAHSLIRHARAVGTQHQLAWALTAAYFLDRRNIGDLETLATIASEHGLSKEQALSLAASRDEIAATRKQAAASAASGVRSVPHLLVNGVATPLQDEARLIGAIGDAIVSAC